MNSKGWILVFGVVAGGLALWMWLPRGGERLDPPEVLEQRVLQGPTVEVQSKAAADMVRHGEQARPVVRRTLAEYRGNDPDVLMPLAQGAMKQRDWQSLPRLFELMEHPDPRVRGKAGAAAAVIMDADYGFRAEAPPDKRREALLRIRLIHSNMLPELQRAYPEKKP